MSQLLSDAQMEAILPASAIRHQCSSALFLLELGDVIPKNLRLQKEEDIAEKQKKKRTIMEELKKCIRNQIMRHLWAVVE